MRYLAHKHGLSTWICLTLFFVDLHIYWLPVSVLCMPSCKLWEYLNWWCLKVLSTYFFGCVLFHRLYCSEQCNLWKIFFARSEQKKLLFFFTAQTSQIKMLGILFLRSRSDLSDQSDFDRSKATERLDKPAHFCLFAFSLLIFPNLCGRFHTLKDFFRHFNRNNF